MPKLKKAIDDVDPPQAMVSAFDVVAAYKNREACEILAGFLRAALEDGEKAEHLDRALWAFSSATGKSFRGAGLFEPAAPRRKQAKEAVKWWNDEGRRLFSDESDGGAK